MKYIDYNSDNKWERKLFEDKFLFAVLFADQSNHNKASCR